MKVIQLFPILIYMISFSSSGQQEAPQQIIKEERNPNYTFAAHGQFSPRFRLSSSIIYDRLSFSGGILFDLGVHSNAGLEHNNLPSYYTDTSMIYEFRSDVSKAFELQLGVGNGRQRTFYTDEEGYPLWFFKWGGQLTFGRYFFESTYGDINVNYSLDTLSNNYLYSDFEGSVTSDIGSARKDILSINHSTLVTHELGFMAYGSMERFLLRSPLSLGVRAAVGPRYSWMYQANGSLYDNEIIPSGGESKVVVRSNIFLFLAWNW